MMRRIMMLLLLMKMMIGKGIMTMATTMVCQWVSVA